MSDALAGWYQDPNASGAPRYWTGVAWLAPGERPATAATGLPQQTGVFAPAANAQPAAEFRPTPVADHANPPAIADERGPFPTTDNQGAPEQQAVMWDVVGAPRQPDAPATNPSSLPDFSPATDQLSVPAVAAPATYPAQPTYAAQPYPAQPYPAQPYAQATAGQAQAWGAPPPNWNSAPAKKRKVWIWVVTGIGTLVAFGIAAIATFAFLGNAAVKGLNPDYGANVVAADDVATAGGTLIIGEGANVAFEVGSAWPDQSQLLANDGSAITGITVTYLGAWSTADLSTAPNVSLVMVEAGEEKVALTSASLRAEHKSGIAGFVGGLGTQITDVQVADAVPYTTASGLNGLHSSFSAKAQGFTLAGDIYTFARGKNIFALQVVSYNGVRDESAIAQVLDTLRIDS